MKKCRGIIKVLLVVMVYLLLMGNTQVEAQSINIERIYGENRYLTAVEISKAGWNSAETVILARSDDFPDALAGTPLAYQYNAPVLLTQPLGLNESTKQEILRLGAKKCIILGGKSAVSTGVEAQLIQMGLQVERIGGRNRYETAAIISERLEQSDTAVIVNGSNFPDALAVAPYAARKGYPILLTRQNSLPEDTAIALENVKNAIVIGGSSVVGQAVYNELPCNTSRIAGENRFDTAVEVVKQLGVTENVYAATGLNFADALTGSVLTAVNNGSLLLVQQNSVPKEVSAFILENNIKSFVILGGPSSVSEVVEQQILNGGPLIGIYDILPGDSAGKVTDLLGQPQRKELELYGWEWWIYNRDMNNYLQVGVKDNRVTAVFSNGRDWKWEKAAFNTSYSSLSSSFNITREILLQYGGANYTLTQSDKQLEQKPAVKTGDMVATFYLDVFDSRKLKGILLMDTESFLRRGGYHSRITYSGSLPNLSVSLSDSQKMQAYTAQEKQTLDLVNTARLKAGAVLLAEHAKAGEVARAHSREMAEHNYFSHTSQVTGKTFTQRLTDAGISYRYAAENIAVGYPDSISTHYGWVNSSKHRHNILNSNYTHLGVGVYEKYYTQNFVTPQ